MCAETFHRSPLIRASPWLSERLTRLCKGEPQPEPIAKILDLWRDMCAAGEDSAEESSDEPHPGPEDTEDEQVGLSETDTEE